MSERLHGSESNFQPTGPEHEPTLVQHEAQPQHTPEKSVEAARKSIESITATVEHEAVSTAEKQSLHTERSPHPALVGKHLKDTSYNRTMLRVQKKLSMPQRYFSKVVHHPAVDKPSEVIGKSLARPSSMLGGSLAALISTLLLYWLVRHFGYEYNFLIAILVFMLGAVVGLSVEGLLKIRRTNR